MLFLGARAPATWNSWKGFTSIAVSLSTPPLLDRLELALGVFADPAHRGADFDAGAQKSDG